MADGMRELMRCVLTPGVGPVLLDRLVEAFGSCEALLGASPRELRACRGIGAAKASAIARGLVESERLADEELALAEKLGVTLLPRASAAYPEVLRSIPSAPPVLYVLGAVDPGLAGVGLVGSRSCTPYGVEQAERFASGLSESGLAVVSGGARGIDAAAHRGALRARGRTLAVLGCGLANRYPPEHGALFDAIVESGGALVSELPLRVRPDAKLFPGRNRIISGLSLGVLVIEAAHRSGSLITARYATEEHGREVMVVPGRVDSAASEGSLGLIKAGGAALVTSPRDVMELVEPALHHLTEGTHARRFGSPEGDGRLWTGGGERETDALASRPARVEQRAAARASWEPDDPAERAVYASLEEPLTMDEVMVASGLEAGPLRAAVTMLEIRGVVRRSGDRLVRASG